MTSPLVDVEWLASHAGDPGVRIVDTRWYLAGKRGKTEYDAGHIPGAAFVDLGTELAGPQARGPGRHPLPGKDELSTLLSHLGVTAETLVVAYDDAGGSVAARLWWLLRHHGHPGGRVLDGGIGAWIASGRPLSTEPFAIEPAAPLDLEPGAGVVDRTIVDAIRREAGEAGEARRPRTLLLDARARARYEGREEPVDARAGHIPTAKSAPFSENLVAPGGVFLPRHALEQRYRDLGAFEAERVVCYCGSGVTACHDLLALALIGREDALLYEGSWSDWAADPSLPIATGTE